MVAPAVSTTSRAACVPSEAVATGGGERVDEAGSGVVVFDAGGGAGVCELKAGSGGGA